MTPEEWEQLCDRVTDAMRAYTRPFATDISSRQASHPHLEGSGSYVSRDGTRFLLTCEHVARRRNLEHRFFGSEAGVALRDSFVLKPDPIDIAWSLIPDHTWTGFEHRAQSIPFERFDLGHATSGPHEVLFFRGFAGENAHYDLVDYKTHGSGYCSQEWRDAQHDSRIFEILWDPEKIKITSGTTDEARQAMQFTDPAGFSGSLVWNTRLLQCRSDHKEWYPSCATVTGIVRRYDPDTKTILALRVEHLRAALVPSREILPCNFNELPRAPVAT